MDRHLLTQEFVQATPNAYLMSLLEPSNTQFVTSVQYVQWLQYGHNGTTPKPNSGYIKNNGFEH